MLPRVALQQQKIGGKIDETALLFRKDPCGVNVRIIQTILHAYVYILCGIKLPYDHFQVLHQHTNNTYWYLTLRDELRAKRGQLQSGKTHYYI